MRRRCRGNLKKKRVYHCWFKKRKDTINLEARGNPCSDLNANGSPSKTNRLVKVSDNFNYAKNYRSRCKWDLLTTATRYSIIGHSQMQLSLRHASASFSSPSKQ